MKKQWKKWIHQYSQWFWIVGFSVLGVFFIDYGIQKQKKEMGLDATLVEVLIAEKTISKGDIFNTQNLKKQTMPQKYVPLGALYPEDAFKFEGQTMTRSVVKGEVILTSAIDIHFMMDNPSSKIQTGYRALSVPVDEIKSVSGSIVAGDHIDLLTTLEDHQHQSTTMTLLQNITVLSVGRILQDEFSSHQNSIVLMVLPDEAPLIMHALKHYDLSIILRNPYDQDTLQNLPMITKDEIIKASFINHMQSKRDQKILILQRDS